MKLFKKVTAVVLAVAMIATTITISNTEAEAKVTLKSKKNITLVVGKKSTIKVKQKGAKFKSSNTKIAKVTNKGKVTAKKPGVCKITVKVKKSKKVVTVKVVPGKVTALQAKNTTENGIQVSWEKLKNVSGYNVYYSTSSKSGFKSVKVGNTNKIRINKLTLGKTYYFKVKAYAKVGGKTYTSASYSNVVSDKVRKLVWNDEFNGTALDSTKWNTNGATGQNGFGNGELQNYQPQYCEVKDGSLVIKPQMEWNPRKNTIQGVKPNLQCYSTKLWTKGMYSMTYGKVEFRAKLPKGKGTWAACWMLGNDENYGKWPGCGEIDVLETTMQSSKTLIPQSIHNFKFNGMPTSSGNKYGETTVNTATSEYHTYGIVWTAKEITFTIDGNVTWTYNPTKYVSSGNAYANNKIWPFNKPFYLIINCAIGGVLGGDVGPDYWTKIGTKTYADGGVNQIYQDYMYVDYVRVYQ